MLYTTLHLHNVTPGREADYAAWFDGPQRQALAGQEGFISADRYEVSPEQMMPDIPQPWGYLSVYDFDYADPKTGLGALIAGAREAGWIDDTDGSERLYSYAMFSDWKPSPNWRPDEPLSGVSIILANFTIGREAEYQRWYDEVHSIEVSNVPGHVGMKRGRLSDIQIEPRRYCPGNQLVLTACQTDDLAFTHRDFSARAAGRSPSGVAMEPRSKAASVARTVHYFHKISGDRFWTGGVAYAGDLSVYAAAERP